MMSFIGKYRREWTFGLAACVVAAVCLHALFLHAFVPVVTGAGPRHWPVESALARSPQRGQIVMFAHPGCPCTRASLSNLAELAERFPDRLDVTLVFATRGLDAQFVADAPIVQAARTLGAARVCFDDGREAQAFGATVSGEVFAFDDHGVAIYHGGLTAARGHVGESEGLRQLELALDGSPRDIVEGPVFGCRLP